MSQHWAQQNERGNAFFLNLTRLIVRYSPLFFVRLATLVVVSYFFLMEKNKRKNIRTYQQRLQQTFPSLRLPKLALFRQFLAFGESIADRFAVWQNKIQYKDLLVDDADQLFQDMNPNARGQILLCSHFGNIEVCRAVLNRQDDVTFRLNVLMHNQHSKVFNQALQKAGAHTIEVIQVAELDVQKMLELNQRLERGEWIAIAADRVPVRGDKTALVDFLGAPAHFPQGAWLLASLLKAPLNTIFCIKENGRYRFKLRRFSAPITGGKQRQTQIQQAMQRYADLLAQECRQNPLLWFNFYDFWAQPDEN